MKRILNWLIVYAFVAVLVLSFIPGTVSAMTGSGTVGDPYMIYNVTDLQNISNNLTAYYELANDIDASATVGWNAGAGFIPVGTYTSPFTGTFDGGGFTISSLFINRPTTDNVGLFGLCRGASVRIENLNMINATSKGEDVGILAGCMEGGYVTNVNVNGSVYSDKSYSVGGLIGYVFYRWNLTIENCSSSGTVTQESDASGSTGGLIGEISSWDGILTITNCQSSCTVTSSVSVEGKVGGLIGELWAGWEFGYLFMTKCYATGNISITTPMLGRVGGLIGMCAYANISECFATGDIVGQCPDNGLEAGGFIGDSSYDIVNDCYSRGSISVSNVSEVGGFLGYSASTIQNCYSTGLVPSGDDVGGFCGLNDATIADCFWDTETSGQATSDGGTGKTTTEMKTESTFTDAGWDFTVEPIWRIRDNCNDGYPYLCQFCYLEWLCIGGCSSYDLTTTSTLGGNVTTPGESTYTYGVGQVVGLNVTPEDGYSFYRWTGQTSTIGDKYSGSTNITMNASYSIMANFQSGDLLPMPVIPIITPEDEEVDPSILPWYDLIHPAAVGLGWRTIDFWSILIIFIAIAMGVGVMIATGSTLLAAITVAIVLVLGVSMSILSLWVVIVYAIFSGSYLIAVRSM